MFAAIVRDTRGGELTDAERYNYFPASPLVTLTCIFEGETRVALKSADRSEARQAPALAAISLSGPQSDPFLSWNPGPVFAISIGFYPDAWTKLFASSPSALTDRTMDAVPEELRALLKLLEPDDALRFWAAFQAALLPRWSTARCGNPDGVSLSRHLVSDWAHALILRSATSGSGRTFRAIQRRLLRWTGHSRRALEFFARIEDLHRLATNRERISPTEVALNAGYADQSHMGRAVRKATGFSPVRLNELIETEEAFWCYRLLGERF